MWTVFWTFVRHHLTRSKCRCILTWTTRQDVSLFSSCSIINYSTTNKWIPQFLAEFLEEHRRVLESRLQPVIREITDSRAKTKEDLESLYRKIVSAILLRSGLGSPTDISVVREATGKFKIYYSPWVVYLHLVIFINSGLAECISTDWVGNIHGNE